MKRDMDLVRRIALSFDDLQPGQQLVELPGVDRAVFVAHVQWLAEAGLVAAALSPDGGKTHATSAIAFRLTWAGCEFADAVRSETLWGKAKQQVIKPSASWTFDVLTEWLKAEILGGLPSLRN